MITSTHMTSVLSSDDIAHMPWAPFGEIEGVQTKALWRDPYGASYAGLMRMAPRAAVPVHRHHLGTHHVWVISGSCEIAHQRLAEGGYAFVPLETDHGIRTLGRSECLMFYLYLATADPD